MCWEEHTAATCAPTLCSLRALPETTCGSVLCRPSLRGWAWLGCMRCQRGVSGADEGTTEPVRGLSGGFLGWASGSERPPVNPLSACWNHLPRCLRGPRDVAVAVER